MPSKRRLCAGSRRAGETECGQGLHLGQWFSTEPDGVYRNDQTNIATAAYDQPFEIWVR